MQPTEATTPLIIDTEFMINHFETTGDLYTEFIKHCDARFLRNKDHEWNFLITFIRMDMRRTYSAENITYEYSQKQLIAHFEQKFRDHYLGEVIPQRIVDMQAKLHEYGL